MEYNVQDDDNIIKIHTEYKDNKYVFIGLYDLDIKYQFITKERKRNFVFVFVIKSILN